MPISKTTRKSRSGQSRKVNRLKNGQHRYRPRIGPVPRAPTAMDYWLGATAAMAIMGRPGEETYRPKPLPGDSRKDPGRAM